jgi:16S rRNA (cytidine1402-2'-O)-methyltransferase
MTNRQATGTLFIVATPIGNREDITLRALSTLKSVDAILAEDTRHSLPLLNALGIKKPLIALHAYNENIKTDTIITKLLDGKSLALISDAGTPLISDPGYPLVKAAREAGIDVVPIPGPCALITAISAAGISCDTFTFGGFLPAKKAARCAKLKALNTEANTLVFYESTHRILDCLDDIAEVFGISTEIVLAKELTKTYERFISGTTEIVKTWLLSEPAHTKGEFVLLIPPRPIEPTDNQVHATLSLLLKELPLAQAVKITALLTGVSKNVVYKMALQME